jgi:hypothetical protein
LKKERKYNTLLIIVSIMVKNKEKLEVVYNCLDHSAKCLNIKAYHAYTYCVFKRGKI